MLNSYSKLISLLLLSLSVFITHSIISNMILLTITLIILLLENVSFKIILKNILKFVLIYILLIIFSFINVNCLIYILKFTILITLYTTYIYSNNISNRYNSIYNLLKKIKLEKYSINIIYFVKELKKEFKRINKYNISFKFKDLFEFINIKLKAIKRRFSFNKFNLYKNDYTLILVTSLFFIIVIFKEVIF